MDRQLLDAQALVGHPVPTSVMASVTALQVLLDYSDAETAQEVPL